MEEIIAKKYAHALIQCFKRDELEDLSNLFLQASQAFCVEKFRDMIHSPYMTKMEKKRLLIALFSDDEQVGAFLDLLIENKRIDIIPFVSSILERYLRALDNSYKAILYAPKNLDSSTISNITDSLSAKLGVKLHIEQSSTKVDGIRLAVQDLGIEVSFLKERFFDDLRSHILRSI
ncbi:F0F1 ATP synthase subunit delta [Helicobacter canis]|uniref:ATP synthase subunit delta n=1 Tax=Helicobacter canis TaxID=29419 RepID=A0A377J4J9_9HELI|nr:F0F1 ATP synthase subunit delta [Helicobacter canis]STO97249.1 ATP synthase F1 sector subunit delta [Helicobacter canis]